MGIFLTWWYGLQDGSKADWIAGLATFGALLFTVIQLSFELRRRKRMEQQEQAVLVGAWFDQASKSLMIRNASTALIYDVVVYLCHPDATKQDTIQKAFARKLRTVPASDTVSVPVSHGWQHEPTVAMYFRDASGQTWYRGQYGHLNPVRKMSSNAGEVKYYEPEPQLF